MPLGVFLVDLPFGSLRIDQIVKLKLLFLPGALG